jgi:hypothetical protein
MAEPAAPPFEAKAGAQAGPEQKTGEPLQGHGLPELRAALIRSLSRDRGILASGIEKSPPWEWAEASVDEKLLIPVRDPLTAGLLKKDYPFIRQILGDLWGKPLAIEVLEIPEEPGALKEPDLAPQAELVLRMFRGTVVKKSDMEKKDANQSL